MTKLSDLSQDLVEEILSKVPITSLGVVRRTCKGWNALCKARILCKADPKEQYLVFMMKDHRLCSMRFDLHGIRNEDGGEFVDPSIKEISNFLNHVYHCDGLLLCDTIDKSRLVIWNPYLGQTKWIQLKTKAACTYALGYDKNKNHKILRFFIHKQGYYEIYDFKSNSWKEFKVINPKWEIHSHEFGESVYGNTYFLAEEDDETHCFLICFSLPFQHINGACGTISCVKEEKLAALYQHDATSSMIEIWVTTKIEPNAVLWIPFLKVEYEPIFGRDFVFYADYDSFFIDEEKKLAVVFGSDSVVPKGYKQAYIIIGEDSYFKKVDLGEVQAYSPLVCCSSYVPSLVQVEDPVARREKRF